MLYFLAIIFIKILSAQEIPSTSPIKPEFLPLHHDDNGFAPLKIPATLYQTYNHNIPAFIDRLKGAFIQEFSGHNVQRAVHMPDWIIWASPIVIRNGHKLTLYMGNKSLDTPVEIGSIQLGKSTFSLIENMEKMHCFINKHIDYDSIQYSGKKIKLVKQEFGRYWTELDDLIMQMLLKRANFKLSTKDQEENLRLIGEFFRWRRLIKEFCQTTFSRENELSLPQRFEDFLVKNQKIPIEEAKEYRSLLDLRRQQLGLILEDPHSSEKVLDVIFKNFTIYGLTKDQAQADRYREDLFPK